MMPRRLSPRRAARAARLARVASALGPILASPGAIAAGQTGVAVDGAPVPAALFRGHEIRGMAPEDVCPPISDAFVRESVVSDWLVAREGGARGLELPTWREEDIEEYRAELDALPTGNVDERARIEATMLYVRAREHVSGLVREVSHQDVLDGYRRFIRARDPRFVDVPVVRRTTVQLLNDDQALRAEPLLHDGMPAEDVAARLGLLLIPGESERWIPVGEMRYYEGDASDVETGAWLGPFRRGAIRTYLYIDERKTLSRIRPNQELDGKEAYARSKVRTILQDEREARLRESLRAAATVTVNGARVDPPSEFPACPG